MRIAVIDRDKCKPKKCGYLCEKSCPGVRMGDETITHEENDYPVISEQLCTGCGICTKKCPYGAISIINLPEELDRPVHRYGTNAFALYRLPSPKPNAVVGIIGPNGIGKTTALNILAGHLHPNLGKEKAAWDEIIEYHRGQEIQNHLEKVSKGKTKIAFKPQNVDQIPKRFSGTVSELLDGTAERKISTRQLGIDGIMNKKVGEISGGELQRVAIGAAMGKEADLYCFDEPSSYLDVKQRLIIAKAIRNLASDNKVLVIEHDLAVLDYLSDYIHILYGKNGVYGVVSSLKGVRVGINEFLDGYITTENMRFRDKAIRFEVKPPSDTWKGKQALEFGGFSKSYPGFSLDAEAGTLRKGEVIGIMGPNAIGKTTFMKVLAGIEKPDKGKLDWSAKISYKPQYITSDFNGSVRELINDTDLEQDIFDSMIKRQVEDLYDKEVMALSGGELQRVGIALALARPCELCLLDEPSAFLDVEQRIAFADIIRRVTEKRGITTMIIDHDITMQDYVSDRVMIFDGEPGASGAAKPPESMHSGMNSFLGGMEITYRRDPETGRPRANKPNSQKDSEQKKSGEYYYTVA